MGTIHCEWRVKDNAKTVTKENQVFTRIVFSCVSVNLREVTYESFQVVFFSSKYLVHAKKLLNSTRFYECNFSFFFLPVVVMATTLNGKYQSDACVGSCESF